MKRALLPALLAGLLLAGCGNSRAVLYSGVSPGSTGTRTVITDAVAARDGKAIRAQWIAAVTRAGRDHPGERFRNLSVAEFRRRLSAAAKSYDFTVRTLRFLHPRQLAPLVVVETTHYVQLARAARAIDASLDPLLRDGGRPRWAFEGFLFEAVDERGVPFFAFTNRDRGTIAGGNWARAEKLYPFLHG